MNKLLKYKPELEKTANVTVPADPTQWVKVVITEFLTQYPQLQKYPVTVRWIKKAENKGFALGVIDIFGGSVPIIINNYQVSPMDVLLIGNTAIPLTPERVTGILSTKEPFKGLAMAAPKVSLELFGERVQFAPNDSWSNFVQPGSYVRDAVKVGSFIDRISVDVDSVKRLFGQLDNSVYSSFEKNGTAEILEKLANKKLEGAQQETDFFLRTLDVDRQYTFTDNEGNKFVKQANALVDHVWEVALEPGEDVRNLVNDRNVTEITVLEKLASFVSVDNFELGDTGKFISKKDTEETPEITIVAIEKIEELSKFAYYQLPEYGGILIDSDHNYYLTNNSVEKVASRLLFDGDVPEVGDYGFFEKQGKALTRPFEVTATYKVANVGNYEIDGLYGLGKKAQFFPLPNDFEDLVIEGNKTYVPGTARFIKLAKPMTGFRIAETAEQLVKTASGVDSDVKLVVTGLAGITPTQIYVAVGNPDKSIEKIAHNKYKVYAENVTFAQPMMLKEAEDHSTIIVSDNYVGRDKAGLYYFGGRDLGKYAQRHPSNSLTCDEVVWALVHCGASEEDINKTAMLKVGELYEITNNLSVPHPVSEVTKSIYDHVASQFEEIADIPVLVKEASVMPDSSTADAVLSLGLIKKFNVLEYVNLIPDYHRVLGELAKLLIMVRLGGVSVPEEAVRISMLALAQVVQSLEKIRGLVTAQPGIA